MIKLSDPSISEKAIKRVSDVLRTGNLVQGVFVREFEEAIEKYLQVSHAILVSSGTAALHLSLHALGIGKGDKVIVPAFSFPATANVVELAGATPIFVDIGLDTMCIDPQLVERAITNETKAIIPVHEFGQPADMRSIQSLAQKHKLHVIEDAACAIGASLGDPKKKVGSFGTTGCFSFHPRKTVTTGEGGCITTSSDAVAEKLRLLRNHGMARKDGELDFSVPGFNYRLTEMQAVIGLEQFAELDAFIAHRNKIAAVYDAELTGAPAQTPKKLDQSEATYQTYQILLPETVNRDGVILRLKALGIETNMGAQAIHCQSFYAKKYRLSPPDFPNALRAYRSGLALPMGPHIDIARAKHIAQTCISVIKEWT